MKRFFNALVWFWMALTKPKVFKVEWFTLVESMMKFLEATADANHPMKCELQMDKYEITKNAEINWIKGERTTILHLWCGIDNIDSPFKRINDLLEENENLKRKINDLLNTATNKKQSK